MCLDTWYLLYTNLMLCVFGFDFEVRVLQVLYSSLPRKARKIVCETHFLSFFSFRFVRFFCVELF